MQTVYVVMKNDFILGVYATQEKAQVIAQAMGGRVSAEPLVK